MTESEHARLRQTIRDAVFSATMLRDDDDIMTLRYSPLCDHAFFDRAADAVLEALQRLALTDASQSGRNA